MRIISGRLKGILIQAPKGLPVRPTTDRAKESLFNIIENHFHIDELQVLDIFSGTGNIAYEFASRGAKEIISVDINSKCAMFIKEMKTKHAMSNLQVLKKDAFAFLRSCTQTFDIIFADAPYAHRDIIQIPGIVAEKQLLSEKGWLIVEHESNLDLSSEKGFFDKRLYGQSAFSFFQFSQQI